MKQVGLLSTMIGVKKLFDFWNTLKNAFEDKKLVLLATHCAHDIIGSRLRDMQCIIGSTLRDAQCIIGSRLREDEDIIGSRLRDAEDIIGYTFPTKQKEICEIIFYKSLKIDRKENQRSLKGRKNPYSSPCISLEPMMSSTSLNLEPMMYCASLNMEPMMHCTSLNLKPMMSSVYLNLESYDAQCVPSNTSFWSSKAFFRVFLKSNNFLKPIKVLRGPNCFLYQNFLLVDMVP